MITYSEKVNPTDFKKEYNEVVEIFEDFFLMQNILGKKTTCKISENNDFWIWKGFRISSFVEGVEKYGQCFYYNIASNKKSYAKASFEITITLKDFPSRKISSLLKKSGFTNWLKAKKRDSHTYKIYCYENTSQLKLILPIFSEYI